MKTVWISFFFFALCGCARYKYCQQDISYMIGSEGLPDTYAVEGTYCIADIQDTELEDRLRIELRIFDRISGEPLDKGIVNFNQERQLIFDNGSLQTTLPGDTYIILVESAEYVPLSIKFLKLRGGRKYMIECYMGSRKIE